MSRPAVDIGWGGLADLRASAGQLILAGLVYKVLAFAVLTPLVGALVTLFVRSSGGDVVADTDIFFFFLSPIGVATALVVGAVAGTATALDHAGLMSICYGHRRGHVVGFWAAVAFALRRVPGLVEIAGRIVARCLLIAAPFLLAGAGVYFALLAEHDINFYLADRPPIFLVVVASIGALLTIGAGVILYRALGWIVALPVFLFEGVGPSDALRTSTKRASGHRGVLASVVIGWLALSALVGSVPLVLLSATARIFLPWVADSMAGVVILLSLLMGVWAVLNALATLFFAAYFAALAVRLYDTLGDPGSQEMPAGLRRSATQWRPTRLQMTLGVGVTVLAAGISTALLIDGVRTDDDVLVIAHRGASGAAPENTIAAFELAIEQGADFIEIDVQESADGEVMVVHDSDLMKIGRQPLPIWSTTADELRGVDIGSWFAPNFANQRVPTLAEVLELSRGRVRVMIELKYYGREVRLEERFVEEVERLGMADQIVAMSLKYDAVTKLKTLRPDWRVGLLTARALGDLTTTSADFLAVNHAIVGPAFINRARAAGQDVYVWTINDSLNMSRMISQGVDGIITDFPDRTRDVIASRQELSSAQRLLLAAAFYVGLEPREPAATEDTEG
ncbi:MAG: glycerophosphodiester phosphodiesterase [Acidobacteria bacterium]|nr:glycerophosphodiester phosphodiesterase [Acidobacteriota bacterium]